MLDNTMEISPRALNVTQLLARLPACSLNCFYQAVQTSPTILSDTLSACSNTTLQSSLSACIQGVCTFTEQEEVAYVNRDLCAGAPVEDQGWIINVVLLVLGPIALLSVALRCWSRIRITRRLSAEDWVLVVAAFITCAIIIMGVINSVRGFGRHYWNIDPTRINSLLCVFWVTQFLYQILLTIIKTSILLFYLRVFPGKWTRRATLTTMAFVLASGIALTLIAIFQCRPIQGAFIKSVDAKCLDLNTLLLSSACFSITQDLVILVIPIPELVSLRMDMRKKLQVLFMFSIGSLACILSIIRLVFVADFGHSTDPTWNSTVPAIWSFAEVSCMIIFACLPALRALFAKWFPRVFGFRLFASQTKTPRTPKLNLYVETVETVLGSETEQNIGPGYSKRSVVVGEV